MTWFLGFSFKHYIRPRHRSFIATARAAGDTILATGVSKIRLLYPALDGRRKPVVLEQQKHLKVPAGRDTILILLMNILLASSNQ
jgi:hypothetical protein